MTRNLNILNAMSSTMGLSPATQTNRRRGKPLTTDDTDQDSFIRVIREICGEVYPFMGSANYRDSSPLRLMSSVIGPASPIFSATDFACVNSSR